MPWYRDGTISVTLNSSTVTGAATRWISQARVGDGLIGPDGRVYEVVNIASDTSLKIDPAYKGATAAAQPYAISPIQGYVRTLADQAARLLNEVGPTLNGKVDKIEGMGLSANDYTTTDKQKLAGIEVGATDARKCGIGASTAPLLENIDSNRTGGVFRATAAVMLAAGGPGVDCVIQHLPGGTANSGHRQIAYPITSSGAFIGREYSRAQWGGNWQPFKETAQLESANTWTGSQTFQDANNNPVYINAANGIRGGEVRPISTTTGGLRLVSHSPTDTATLDLLVGAGKTAAYRIGRDVTSPAANLRCYTHTNTATESFGVDFKNGHVSAGGLSFNGLRGINSATVLNHYEQGRFTATLFGTVTAGNPTYSRSTAWYTRIGDIVTVTVRIQISSKGGVSGELRIGNLPFLALNESGYLPCGSIGYGNGMPMNSGVVGNPNASALNLHKFDANTTVAMRDTDITDSFHISLTITYKAN